MLRPSTTGISNVVGNIKKAPVICIKHAIQNYFDRTTPTYNGIDSKECDGQGQGQPRSTNEESVNGGEQGGEQPPVILLGDQLAGLGALLWVGAVLLSIAAQKEVDVIVIHQLLMCSLVVLVSRVLVVVVVVVISVLATTR